VRKLVKTLLSLSLMAPAAALALGLGDIKLHSALNQRLDADIELLSVDPAEVNDIDVSLATADTFNKIGLDRPAVLMFLDFEVKQHQNGKYYVHATSKDIIREPFLDFLIEVKWPAGRVLREYTLLLDPPVSQKEAAPMVTAPESRPAAPTQQPAAPAKQPQAAESPAPAPAVSTYYPQPAKPSQQKQKGLVYGPVESKDTLWRIAQKMRPSDDISVQQMMMALLKANPYAFYDNNINRLKKGYVLRIDDPALLKAMNKAEAAREVSRQTREWQDYRKAAAAKAAERKPAAAEKMPAGAAAAKSEPKLKLVAPKGDDAKQAGTSAEGKAASGDMNEQLMLALESSAAQRKENEELQSRVNDLEEQLQDMQRLLALKDADLATLQKQLREQGQSVTLPSEKAAEAEAAKPEEKMADVQGAAGTAEKPQPETAGQKEQPAEQAPGKGEAANGKMAEGEQAKPAGEEKAPAAAAGQKQPQPKPVAKPKPKPRVMPQPVKQPSFIESLLQDPIMLGAGGGTLLLLLILVFVMIRRRRKGGFQESILSGGTSSMLNTKGDEASGETSFLSDLAISGMGGGTITADEGEVDPLTEADVFMAYGRNQQAEEVLKKALEGNPDRPEVIAKLLEVYYNTKDQAQFDSLAGESADKLKANDEIWSKVAAMGHELSPDNDLFAGAEAAPAPAPAQEPDMKGEPVTDDVLDIGLDLDELTAEMEGEASDEDFDLGLDLPGDESDAGNKPAESAESELSDMDFDLDLGEEEPKPDEAPAKQADAAAEEESTDLDFDLGELETEQESEPAQAGSEDLSDFDFELGELSTEEAEAPAEEEFSFDLETGGAEEESAAEPEQPKEDSGLGDMDLGDIDFGDLDLEGGEAEEAPTGDAGDEEEGEFSLDLDELESSAGGADELGDLGDLDEDSLLDEGDEITTKLDLAQAYIEMGDNDGARSMLEEVVEAGNDEQKQQAQDLLSKI